MVFFWEFSKLFHNPVGVAVEIASVPGVARSLRPWALGRNPFGDLCKSPLFAKGRTNNLKYLVKNTTFGPSRSSALRFCRGLLWDWSVRSAGMQSPDFGADDFNGTVSLPRVRSSQLSEKMETGRMPVLRCLGCKNLSRRSIGRWFGNNFDQSTQLFLI